MSHEYYNIVIGGEGVRRRSNGINAEKITFFNNFVRVSKGLLSTIVASEIDAVPNPLLSGDATERNSNVKFEFDSITVKKIRDAIAKIKTTKGFGKENISCYFLKLATPFIEKSLADLFNMSIETSQFPDLWKSARVTPIFKEGDKAEMSNYRPMSVLPVIARLFEKLISNKLYQHMNDNGYFSSEQSGFLRLRSTVTNLIKSTDDWYNGMDL